MTEVHAPSLSLSATQADKPLKTLSAWLLPIGYNCVGKPNQPLFRVIIARDDAGRSGLMISISHVLADGHTYYRILQMFNDSEAVTALDATRNASVHQAAEAQIDAFYLTTPGAAIGFLTGLA